MGNLIALCKDCHNQIHHGTIEISNYDSSNKGIVCNVKYNKEKKRKKKFSENDVEIIKNLRNINASINIKRFIQLLKEKNNIQISQSTLSNILDNKY